MKLIITLAGKYHTRYENGIYNKYRWNTNGNYPAIIRNSLQKPKEKIIYFSYSFILNLLYL